MATVKWYVERNFVSRKPNDRDWHGDSIVAECESHEAALEIAEARNMNYKEITLEIAADTQA